MSAVVPNMEDVISPDDRDLLEFEATHPARGDRKLAAIRVRFDLSSTGYYARLHALLDRAEVEAEFPQVVRRAQRQRARAVSVRSSQRFAQAG